jgi:L-lactate dehydrogenase complex protein LldE
MRPVHVQLMITCLGDVIRPSAGRSLVNVLRRLGSTIDFPSAQTCCGQPMFNSGFHDLAREQAKHTIRAFEGGHPVVTPSGSCAAMVKKEYPHLFEGDDADSRMWLERANELAARTFEFSDYLVNRLGVTDVGARFQGRVAYHYACHLRLLGQTDEVEKLIRAVEGAELILMPRQDQCCGFGGSFAVRYPQISGAMVDDKLRCLTSTQADALVSTDAGCLMNIGGRLHRRDSDFPKEKKVEVLHIAELLDRR